MYNIYKKHLIVNLSKSVNSNESIYDIKGNDYILWKQ